MIFTIILVIIIIAVVAYIVKLYNDLVGGRNKVKNSWSQIDVQLTRRADLILNLVETVKGYASHEQSVLTEVTEARAGLMNASSVKEAANANNILTDTLKSLFAVAESYPDLKANQNFLDLQNQLTETENKIAYARQFYNDTVLMYNNQCERFPSNIIASLFKFNQADFFEADESAAEAPKVKF